MDAANPALTLEIAPEPGSPEHAAEMLRVAAAELYAMRRRRDKYVPRELLGEPGWDIMLAIYAHRQEVMTSTDLCHSSASPQTTGLRWIQALAKQGLIAHVHPPQTSDQRLKFYALTSDGRAMIERALRAMLRD
jgi:DNA-binding MarR family transcriptional regulator